MRYAKAFLVFLPLWLILLLLLPHWGLALMPSLLGASMIAGGFAVAAARMFKRPDPQATGVGLAPRRRVNPPGRVTLVVLTFVVVLYVVLVLRAGG